MEKLNLEKIYSLYKEPLKELNTQFIIYGIGSLGENIINILKSNNITPVAICDSNPLKIGKKILGLEVISIQQALNEFIDFNILIASETFYEEIRAFLLKYVSSDKIFPLNFVNKIEAIGFKSMCEKVEDRFVRLHNNLYDEKSKKVLENILMGRVSGEKKYYKQAYSPYMYFNDITCLTNNESFIDGGAASGETFFEFIKLVNNDYKKIYAYEPFEEMFNNCIDIKNRFLENDQRIILNKVGLYSSCRTIGFDTSIGEGSCRIDESFGHNTQVNVVSLDDTINDDVTFIKLDIEGSELEALKGAKKIIQKNKPKLAICVYHKTEDLLTIPEYIMSLGLPYKYYLRHHGLASFYKYETVFYAV